MALYNHFATKDELVDALLDRVLSRFAPEPPTDDWVEDLRGFARAHCRVLTQHPWAVAPIFTRPNPGPSAVAIGDHAFGILARGGFTEDDLDTTGITAKQMGEYGSDRHYERVLGHFLDGLDRR